ncbi:MAG: hypothetical protein CVU77_08205 [Elusimicrobia bacterium HGW-Elusimicrobia-1]|jgi:predicted phage tail protein|nr:MAG: hypothetical protein CVU77_08205 [Elusimicrobia bacterium HGW-Elusimicrobia-1]
MDEKDEIKNYGSPDSVLKELMHAEKSVAEESLRLAKRRFDRERERWEKVIETKHRELLSMQHRLELSEAKTRVVEKKFDEERETSIDRIRSQAAELETQRMNQTRRWASVEEEVKKYRTESDSLRAALTSLRSELSDLRRKYSDEDRRLKDEISAGEEKILALKEKILADEQSYLKEKYELKEKITVSEEKLSRAETALNDEKLHRGKLSAKMDEEVKALKESLLEKIKVITSLEESRIEEERLRIRAEERMSATELEASNLKASVDEERRAFAKRAEEDRAVSEAKIKEISVAARVAADDGESRSAKMSRSIESLEKALAEERAAKIVIEQKAAEIRTRLDEKTVAESELKRRLYTLELERNSEINRHDSEILSKERVIKRLESQVDKRRVHTVVDGREEKK